MKKLQEINNPASCLNRAYDDEELFTLMERDVATPATIRYWANTRIILGKNHPSDEQIIAAFRLAEEIEKRRGDTSIPWRATTPTAQ